MARGIFTLKQQLRGVIDGSWSPYTPPKSVEYLAVAGGGGAGNYMGGGGGAGGLLQGLVPITAGSPITVTVGAGGSGNTGSGAGQGGSGSNSVFGSISAIGGGGGAGNASGASAALSGGSGGGGTYRDAPGVLGAQGIAGQGNKGGNGNLTSTTGGGGGGGAGSAGGEFIVNYSGGNGGAGITSAISGTVTAYAGGGGGGAANISNTNSTGGVGGGGVGGTNTGSGTAGTVNTGGGGGGGTAEGGTMRGWGGGSGIVIVRYPGNIQFYTGGTLNYSNGFMVHTFYSSGTLAPTTPRLFASPDYQISRSLRFNSADGTIVDRAGGAGGNRQTWTWSGWVKRSKLNTGNTNVPFVFGASDRAAGSAYLQFGRYGSDSDIDCLNFNEQSGGNYNITTEAKFRDMSAWYHVVCAYNTTQAVASDRVKIYVNGVLQTITSGSTYPPQNINGWLNYPTFPDLIGAYTANSNLNLTFDGYMAEVNFVDGQQLTPASFGYTEPTTGVWTPLQYVGSYGTRGYYLNFADNSNTTAATLGKDLSGNANNFTPTNFSVTAGVNNDSLVDSPTNYGTDTGAGGEVRGNYATFNPLQRSYGTIAYSDGNLVATNSDSNWNAIGGTIGISTGKWYWEYTSGDQNSFFGFQVPTINYSAINPQDVNAAAGSVLICDDNQYKIDNNTRVSYGSTGHPSGTVVGIAVDMDAGTAIYYKNGTSLGTITWTSSAAYGKTVVPMAVVYYNNTVTRVNFGQRPFAYTAPSGYKALCAQNLPTSILPQTAIAVNAFTGSNSSRIIGTGIQSDLVLTKRRDGTYPVLWHDALRGAGRTLYGNDTIAEVNNGGSYIQTFNSDSYGIGASDNALNVGGGSFVSWTWNAGGTTVTNTTGGISAQVRANPAAGFSIVTYTGTNTSSTIGHGLITAPSLIIVKRRDSGSTNNWIVYHLTSGATKYLYLNTTAAADTWVGFWNNTSPTSSVFTIGNDGATNANGGTYVAYCWAEIPGYSRFGSYVGNASTDGPFVYCGFRPRWIMIKNITGTSGNWVIYDTARNIYNLSGYKLGANLAAAENDNNNLGDTTIGIDILSNGFKIRAVGNNHNNSAENYVFAAFAESPLKYSRAR